MTKIQNSKRFEHLALDIASNFNIRISNLLFYLLILFLPTQLGPHFWPDFSFVSGVRIDYLAPTVYLTDILVLLLFITFILEKKFSIFNFQFSIKSKFKNFNIKNSFQITNYKFQIVLLATVILIGIVFSKNHLAGLYGFIKLLEFVFLGFYTANNIKKLRFDIVLVLFSVGIIFESLLAIFQYVNQTSIGGIFYFFGERTFNSQTPGIANASVNGNLVLRPYGTFSHPNVLAGYLTIAMAMVIFNFQFSIFNFRRIFYILTLLIGTIALFLTMSRVAIILWLITVALWFMYYDWQKLISSSLGRHSGKRSASRISNVSRDSGQARMTNRYMHILKSKNFKLKILIVGFVAAILLISPLRFRFTDIKLTDESIVERSQLIKDSFSMIKSHPIFGVGLNNFLVELPNVHKQDANVFYLQPVHNIFLLVTAQTGIVGLIFFLWFIFKTYKRIRNQELRIKERKVGMIHNSLFLILLTSVLTLGMFDHYFLTLQQGQLLFSFILGLCWAKSPKRQ